MGRALKWVAMIGCCVAVVACDNEQKTADCEPRDGLVPICGIPGSEDLEVLPGGMHLLVSQAQPTFNADREMHWLPGTLGLLNLRTETLRALYPLSSGTSGSNDWGDDNCPGEIGEALSPHGIHLSERDDGTRQLLVVNHGGRESVEMFEVNGAGDELNLTWRGCTVMPERSFLNDVVALAGGGFLVTHMIEDEGPQALVEGGALAAEGQDTGHVWCWQPRLEEEAGPAEELDAAHAWCWQPGESVVKLSGSDAPMPNGIQIDATGRNIFVSVGSNGGEVRRFDLLREQWTGAAPVEHPDNLSWAADGRLLAAGVTHDSDSYSCMVADFRQYCGAEFHVDAVDTTTMTATTLLRHEGPPMGLATVAVQAGDSLYLGSAAGDRIVRYPVPK